MYKAEQWNSLQTKLADYDWWCWERGDAACSYTFCGGVWSNAFSKKIMHVKKRIHPWINARCEQAVAAKSKAGNTSESEQERLRYMKVLAEEHKKAI